MPTEINRSGLYLYGLCNDPVVLLATHNTNSGIPNYSTVPITGTWSHLVGLSTQWADNGFTRRLRRYSPQLVFEGEITLATYLSQLPASTNMTPGMCIRPVRGSTTARDILRRRRRHERVVPHDNRVLILVKKSNGDWFLLHVNEESVNGCDLRTRTPDFQGTITVADYIAAQGDGMLVTLTPRVESA